MLHRLSAASLVAGLVVLFFACVALYAIGGTSSARGASISCRGHFAVASYYGAESGSRTANGEQFDGSSLTAASRTLPFGTKLRVTYRGKAVVVRVNDRGPFVRGRALDLAHAAAKRIGLIPAGVGKVCIERIGK